MPASDLTQGPVWRALARISAPMSLGILAVLSVGIADAYFLGQLGGEPLAAVGYIYPVTTALTSLSIGLSAGANAAISQAIGRKENAATVARLAIHTIILGSLLASAVAAVFWLLYPSIFALMGASDAVMTEISAYVPIWCLSFTPLVLMMVINAVFRAHGNSVNASIFMIVAAVVNIALNPLLIFGWGDIAGLGTAGAAWATLVGRVVACIVAAVFAVWAGYIIRCGKLSTGVRDSVIGVASVGAPAAFSNAINPAGMALVTAAVATLGDAAVAGFGAATRVQSITLVVLFALSSGIGPVVGQNWGAEHFERARQAVAQSWAFCVVYGALLGVGLSIAAEPLATTIARDGEAAQYAAQYLRIVGWSLFGYGILVTINAAMNARSKAVYSMGLSLGRIFVVYLPLAWGGVMLFGYEGILAAAVLANALAALAAIWCASRTDLLVSKNALREGLTG
ncbi:MATE family efflux transporter [Jannaschia sp. EhC01]|nr:MATE family efflux transporter [Jannaschia sp. EhC01]